MEVPLLVLEMGAGWGPAWGCGEEEEEEGGTRGGAFFVGLRDWLRRADGLFAVDSVRVSCACCSGLH